MITIKKDDYKKTWGIEATDSPSDYEKLHQWWVTQLDNNILGAFKQGDSLMAGSKKRWLLIELFKITEMTDSLLKQLKSELKI